MNRRTILSALVATVLLVAGSGSQAAQKVIRVGVAAEPYPPFTSQDAKGEWSASKSI